jgi:hypothetical protein
MTDRLFFGCECGHVLHRSQDKCPKCDRPRSQVDYAQDEGRAKLPPPCDVDDPKEGGP